MTAQIVDGATKLVGATALKCAEEVVVGGAKQAMKTATKFFIGSSIVAVIGGIIFGVKKIRKARAAAENVA